MQYAYLFGMLGVGLLWAVCFFWRKDLRHQMLWTGGLYASVMTAGFFAVKLFRTVPECQTVNPGYWSPETLFDLSRVTGGFSVEDLLFMVFLGGIAGVMYELTMRVLPTNVAMNSGIKVSIPFGVIVAALVAHTGANLMYSIITFGFVGALVIWFQRPDLIRRSLVGGLSFTVLYIGLYLVFLVIYPSFVQLNYHVNNVSGVLLSGIPLEEYLFAFGFGSMWSVIYPYMRNRE